MDRIRIRGGNRLNGTIPISGAKNAALPLMIVSLLSPGTLTLSNVPRLADVRLLQREQLCRSKTHRASGTQHDGPTADKIQMFSSTRDGGSGRRDARRNARIA